MTIANLKRICIEPATYAQELLNRAESAEATAAELRAQLATAQARISEAQIPCETCGGSGFSKPGSGYDAVCDDCSGGYVGYATGEMVNKMQGEIDNLRKKLMDFYDKVGTP